MSDYRTFVFDQWSHPFDSTYHDAESMGDMNPNGAFESLNMMLYRTGMFGVRPGLKVITWTSKPTADVVMMDSVPGDPKIQFLIDGNDNIYRLSAVELGSATAASTATNSVNNDNNSYSSRDLKGDFLYLLCNNGAYRVDKSGTVTQLTTTYTATGAPICRYRERVFIGNGSQLQYSAAGDDTSWTAADNIEFDGTVHNLLVVGDSLYIMAGSGLFILDGSPLSGRLRQVPSDELRAQPEARSNGQIGVHPHDSGLDPLIIGNRQGVRRFEHLRGWLSQAYGSDSYIKYDINQRGSILGMNVKENDGSDNRNFLLFTNGLWTRHTTEISGGGVDMVTFLHNPQANLAAGLVEDFAVFCDNGPASPDLYRVNFGEDRPGTSSANYANVGDGKTTPNNCWWNTGIITPANGARVRVYQVDVAFELWDTGSATDEGFTLGVESHGEHSLNTPATYTRAASTQSYSGTTAGSYLKQFNFGDNGFGSSFQLKFTNVHGVAFRRVKVRYVVEEEQL